MGINSLPVVRGPDRAAMVACAIMVVPQVIVIGLLLGCGLPIEACIVVALLGGQIWMMQRRLRDHRAPAETHYEANAFNRHS